MPSARAAVPVEVARARVLAALEPLPMCRVALAEALGRTLARDAAAGWPLPAADHSAMDGYAGRATDLGAGAPLRLAGRAQAGTPFAGTVEPGQVVRILTGAELPRGADTVVRQEDVAVEGGTVCVRVAPAPGANVRRRGEDAGAGQVVLEAGARLGPAQIAALAATGHDPVWVYRRPRVHILTTGDELLPASAAAPGGVVDSAGPMLAAACQAVGARVERTGPVPDEPSQVRAALQAALDGRPDLLLTVGGASVGDRDYVRSALADLGWRCQVEALRLKPGKPGAFGTLGGAGVFALPGNPTAAFAVFHLLVAPALDRLAGGDGALPEITGRLLDSLPGAGARLLARRCVARVSRGQVEVRVPPGLAGSHRVASVAGTNALVLVPPGSERLEPGAEVRVLPTDPDGW